MISIGPDETGAESPAARGGIYRAGNLLVLAILAVGLSISLYGQANSLAHLHFHNIETFFHYEIRAVPGDDLSQAWKPRVFSSLLAKSSLDLSTPYASIPLVRIPRTRETNAIGQWTALWFLAMAGVYLGVFRERALIYLLGTYAGITFGYMPGLVDRIYPWDMPALFFFVLVVSLMVTRLTPWAILPVIWLGIPFKETVGVLAIFPLFFGRGGIRLRALQTGAALAGCVLVKVGVDFLTSNTDIGLTMAHRPTVGDPLLIQNLRSLATLPPWFANAGLLLCLFLVPVWNRRAWGLRAIGLLFLGGNFAFGIITELRIWFEAIPLALFAFHLSMSPGPQDGATGSGSTEGAEGGFDSGAGGRV